MARIRYIKPGFFENEHLAECEPLARLLFAGLWCWADREGRIEDRPRRIKNQILGYDDCDIDALLQQLLDRGFIARYERDGGRFICIPEFENNQKPHKHEPPSTIPAPQNGNVGTTTDIVRSEHEHVPYLPHGEEEEELVTGNGELGRGTENGDRSLRVVTEPTPSEFDHPVWGEGAKSNNADPVFHEVSGILEVVGYVYQEKGLIETLVEYKDEPSPVQAAKQWQMKYGGQYRTPGQRLSSYRNWLSVLREERKNGPKVTERTKPAPPVENLGHRTPNAIPRDTVAHSSIPEWDTILQVFINERKCSREDFQRFMLGVTPSPVVDGILPISVPEELYLYMSNTMGMKIRSVLGDIMPGIEARYDVAPRSVATA